MPKLGFLRQTCSSAADLTRKDSQVLMIDSEGGGVAVIMARVDLVEHL